MKCSFPFPDDEVQRVSIVGVDFDVSNLPDLTGGILLNSQGVGGLYFVLCGQVLFVTFVLEELR